MSPVSVKDQVPPRRLTKSSVAHQRIEDRGAIGFAGAVDRLNDGTTAALVGIHGVGIRRVPELR